MTVMAGATIAPSLPQLQKHFEAVPHAELLSKLVLTGPALFIGCCAPPAGWLVDRIGRRPVILWGLVLYAIGGTSGLYLATLPQLLAGRALLGVAVAAIMTGSTTLIADYYHGPARQRVMGLQGATMALGAVVFLILGGMLADQHWRGPFTLYFASLLLIPMLLLLVPEPPKHDANAEGEEAPAALPTRVVASLLGLGFVGMLLFYLLPVMTPDLATDLLDATPGQAGRYLAMMTCASIATAIAYQRLRERLRPDVVLLGMFTLVTIGFWIIAHASGRAELLTGLAVSGLGFGVMVPHLQVLMADAAPAALRGRLMGALGMAFVFGQFVSPIAAHPARVAHGLQGNLGVFGAGAHLALLFALLFGVRLALRR